jgi:glycosyltransferase involved in cell wall biosynthesis
MSKVFMIGFSLPSGGNEEEKVQAYNLRAQQFVEALSSDGHVIVYVARPQLHFEHTSFPEAVDFYHEINISQPGWHSLIKKLVKDTQPDCCVTCDFFSSFAASFFKWNIPLWMDIYGDPIAEKQAQLHSENSDRGLFAPPTMESRLLQKGDKFSTCSTPQKYALIGKLGLTGRLNRHTFGYHLVHALPPSIVSFPESFLVPHQEGIIRTKDIDHNDFILLWAGGYNVWMDAVTLFKGLDRAMESDPHLRFVSTGGPVVHDKPYREFRQLINQSRNKDRYHFLGWIPRRKLIQLYRECDCGLSIDSDCYEAELGTRSRLLEMLALGLPVITSAATEISASIFREEFGRVFEIGDEEQLSTAVLEMASVKRSGRAEKREDLAKRAKQRFSSQEMCLPLVRWCRHPVPAPDKNTINPAFKIKGAIRGKMRDFRARWLGVKYIDQDDHS